MKQGIAFADSQTEGAVLDFDAVKLYSALVTKDVNAKLIDQLCMGEWRGRRFLRVKKFL